MILRYRAFAGLLGVAAFWASTADATTPAEYLAQALNGPRQPFSGTQHTQVFTDYGTSSASLRIWGDGRGRIRRLYLDGAAKGIISLQVQQKMWQRNGSEWVRLPQVSENPVTAATQIVKNYRVTAGVPAILLGRNVIPLHIDARHAFNPSRRMWLEPTTGVTVRDDLYGPDGRLRTSTRFTTFTPGKQSVDLFATPSSVKETNLYGPNSFHPMDSAAAVTRATGLPVPKPGHVPSGYRPSVYGAIETRSGVDRPAVRYSDGLSAFTILQRGRGPGPGAGRGGPGNAGRGPGRGRGGPGAGRGRGPNAGFSGQAPTTESTRQRSSVMIDRPQANYMLVGDLALSELLKVAESLP